MTTESKTHSRKTNSSVVTALAKRQDDLSHELATQAVALHTIQEQLNTLIDQMRSITARLDQWTPTTDNRLAELEDYRIRSATRLAQAWAVINRSRQS